MWAPVIVFGCLITACAAQSTIVQSSRLLAKDPTYVIVAPRHLRPNQVLRVSASILLMESDTVTVRASVRSGVQEVANGIRDFHRPSTLPIDLTIPGDVPEGNRFSMRIHGYANKDPAKILFSEIRRLQFNIKQLSIFLLFNRPVYKQGQRVHIRAVPIGPALKAIQATLIRFEVYTPSGKRTRLFPNRALNAGGVVSVSYMLSADILEYGQWKVVARSQKTRVVKHFTVVEWYPALFVVNVSMPTGILDNAKALKWRIHTIHQQPPGLSTKGEVINYIDIRRPGASKPEANFTVRNRLIDRVRDFVVPMKELKDRVPVITGRVIRIETHIREWFWNVTEIGYQSTFVFPSRPHLKFIGGNATTFRPNLPFTMRVAVVYGDGSPVKGKGKFVQLRVNELRGGEQNVRLPVNLPIPPGSIVSYSFTPGTATRSILIEATYENDLETGASLYATRFYTTSDAYLHVETSTKNPHAHEYNIFSVTSNMFVDVIYYHIVAGGNVMVSNVLPMQSRHKIFSVALSKEMSPSARIVAYFVSPDGQIIADSLHFHVSGIDPNKLKVSFNRAKDQTTRSLEISAQTDPITNVVFSGVLASLYRLGMRNGLTYEDVYKEMYTFDSHADSSIIHEWIHGGQMMRTEYLTSRGHAYDTASIFYNSGLMVMTDAGVSTAVARNSCRIELGYMPCFTGDRCYNVKLDKCNTNSVACPNDYAHLANCEYKPAVPYNPVLYGDPNWRLHHIVGYFPAGMFVWTQQWTRPNGRLDSQQRTMGPPKGWAVYAFTVSPTNGLLILPQPKWFGATRTFQMGVRGPQSMRMKEQAGMRVYLFNRWKHEMDILVILHASKDYKFVEVGKYGIVSSADPLTSSEEHHILIPSGNRSRRHLYVPITPTRTGRITVTITSRCAYGHQTARHRIMVESVGIREAFLTTYQVDMRKTLQLTLPDLRVPLPEHPFIPEVNMRQYVPGSRQLSVHIHGSVVGLTFYPDTAYRLSVKNMLKQPYGSGEQALFNLGLNAQILKYERSLDRLSGGQAGRVIETLNNFLQEVYAFQNPDGSFRQFRWSKTPSVWLTAMAAQVMMDTVHEFLDMQPNFVITGGVPRAVISWLANKQDNVTGEFREISALYCRRMETGLMRNDTFGGMVPANAAMTAHATIALIKASRGGFREISQTAVTRGLDYLQKLINVVTDPFEMALITYAFSLDGSRLTSIGGATKRLEEMAITSGTANRWRYWSKGPVKIPTVEANTDSRQFFTWKEYSTYDSYATATTSYAMLSYIQQARPDKAADLQEFLQMSHRYIGGFQSTQDTLIAVEVLRAISNANIERTTYGISYNVTSTTPDTWSTLINARGNDFPALHSAKVPTPWGNVHIEAQGFGLAQVQMASSAAREFPELIRETPTVSFKYDIQVYPRGFNHSILDYKICSSFVGEDRAAGVVTLVVGIPSGYQADNRSLHASARDKNRDNTLMFAYFYDQQVCMYFDSMNKSSQCVAFTVYRWWPIAGIAERQTIRLAELYESGHFVYNFYRVVMLFKNNICQVCGSYQCPYCPGYAGAGSLSPTLLLILLMTWLLREMIS